jgi:hypothetical protein
MPSTRRFPPPWTVEENRESFVIHDAIGQPLACVYFEDEPQRQMSMKRLSRDEARRIAANIAKLGGRPKDGLLPPQKIPKVPVRNGSTLSPFKRKAGYVGHPLPPKHPMAADFDVRVRESGVDVTFRPTASHYSFAFLADPKDIAQLGRLSRSAIVRHAKTGDTGEYYLSDVETLAFRLASGAIRSSC